MIKLLLIPLLLLASCTDASFKQITVLGSKAHIICYSGGKVILDTWSTGKIASEAQSDGWYFEDTKTRKLIRVSGDCLIEN